MPAPDRARFRRASTRPTASTSGPIARPPRSTSGGRRSPPGPQPTPVKPPES